MELFLKAKTKNRIQKYGDFEYHLRNFSINGNKRGCYGFVVNPTNGKIVYLNTEESCYAPFHNQVIWRSAAHLEDYRGGRNRWSDVKTFAHDIANYLNEN